MPFPFFRLPFEIRLIIYRHLFTPTDRNTPIAPDVSRIRRRREQHLFRVRMFAKGRNPRLRRDIDQNKIKLKPGTVTLKSQALSLVRTCQQAYEECTSVIYGDSTFQFDDIPYDDEDDSLYKAAWSDSGVFFPHCEMIYLYPFLSEIGATNRMKIRHLVLKFNTESFVTFLGDNGLYAVRYEPSNGGASFINDALDLFSESHQLQSLSLVFSESSDGMAGLLAFFTKGSRLYRRLTQFKSIEKLECSGYSDLPRSCGYDDDDDDAQYAVFEKAMDNWHELRAKMAAAYALEREQIGSSSAKNRFQRDCIAQNGVSNETLEA